jgi:hypothetical protein
MIRMHSEEDGAALRFVPGHPYRENLCRRSAKLLII